MKKNKIRIALTTLLAAVFLVSAVMAVRRQIMYQDIIADSSEAVQIAGLYQGAAPQQSVLPQGPGEPGSLLEPLPEEAAGLANIDLDALRAVNGDVVGWITIPGTELSYPLMQGTDNQYYLTHNWKKESSGGGAVFLESTGSPSLSDFHTIVYAHRMGNDTMFGTLKYYKDAGFWQEHPHIYLVIDDGIYYYDIFSAQEAAVNGIVYRLDIRQSGLETEFLQSCIEGSVIDTGITPETSDKILTLSTCTASGHSSRWVVHGVLTQEYSREDS